MDWDKVRPVLLVAVPLVGLAIWLIRWFAKHDQWMKGIDEFKRETKEALNEIRTDIKKLLSNLPPSVIGSTSPLQLTDLGREVSECVDASAWARRTAPELLDEVKGKSAYEIQEFCVAHMRNKHQPTVEQDRSFKECAYEHGIKLEQVLDVCALELRDRLLELVDSEATA